MSEEKEPLKGEDMETVGSIDAALAKYDGYMKAAAHKASGQIRGYFDADDIYNDLFVVLADIHEKYNSIPAVEFTKLFYTAINNFICNLVTPKRTRNRVKNHSLDKKVNSKAAPDGDFNSFLEKHEFNDEDYKLGIIDVLNNVSPEAGNAILDSLDPEKRGNSSIGIKSAFDEAKRYLTE